MSRNARRLEKTCVRLWQSKGDAVSRGRARRSRNCSITRTLPADKSSRLTRENLRRPSFIRRTDSTEGNTKRRSRGAQGHWIGDKRSRQASQEAVAPVAPVLADRAVAPRRWRRRPRPRPQPKSASRRAIAIAMIHRLGCLYALASLLTAALAANLTLAKSKSLPSPHPADPPP
jgi:hypothetical protein